jgi:hypothetical protein
MGAAEAPQWKKADIKERLAMEKGGRRNDGAPVLRGGAAGYITLALNTVRHSVYLVRHQLPKGFTEGFRWTLVAVMLRDVPHAGASYAAFETEQNAKEFAMTLPIAFQYSVVRHDQLGLDTYVQAGSCMLPFASSAEVKVRRDRGDLGQGPFLDLELPGGLSGLLRRVKNWWFERPIRRGKVES